MARPPLSVLTLLLVLALAPAAHAASASDQFGLVYDDDSVNGETNIVSAYVGNGDGRMHFADSAAGINPLGGCKAEGDVHHAYCPLPDAPFMLARLDAGNDSFSLANTLYALFIDGGPGNDTLTGSSTGDVMSGNAGNDTISAGSGDDVINDKSDLIGVSGAVSQGNDTENGESGNDTIVAGPGADTIDGGSGIDTLDYSARTTATHVTVGSGATDDGEANENDDVSNVEVLLGGSGPDTFVGGGRLVGNGGDDALTGGAGADVLDGGDGNDTLDGAAGGDDLRGGDGVDTASYAGRSAPVTISENGAADDGEAGEADNVRSDVEHVVGGSGGDSFSMRDGRAQTVTCGGGTDTVVADAFDTVDADCESVDRPASATPTVTPTPTPTGGTPATPVAAALRLPTGKIKADRRRRVALKLVCTSGTGGCAGTLVLKGAGRAVYIVAAGRTAVVRITVPKALVRRGGRLTLTARPVIGTAGAPTKLTLPKRH